MYYIVFWDNECHIRRPEFYDWDEGITCVYPTKKIALREATNKYKAEVLRYYGPTQPTRNPELLTGPINTVWPKWRG